MKRIVVEWALWFGALLFAAISVKTFRLPRQDDVGELRIPSVQEPRANRDQWGDSVASAAAMVADHDPFRITHEPSDVSFGETVASPSRPATSRPTLSLRGLVGAGGRWSAVILGVPGQPGTVLVTAGDTLAGLRVRRVTSTAVVIDALDTTWVLKRQVMP